MADIKVALLQTNPTDDKKENVRTAFKLVEEAAAGGADLVALPEAFVYRGADLAKRWEAAETIPGPLASELGALAQEMGVYLLAGSYPERPGPQDPSHDSDPRTYNTSLLFAADGRQLAKYRKIHMFDVEVAGGVTARESARNRSGDQIVTADTEFGKVGLSICYDVRFPEIFRAQALEGAILSFVPSNFALFTGKDHWEVLLRARAIENGIYIIAPATIGKAGEFQAYGRSMIVDPWGTVLATAADEEGITFANIDTERVTKVQSSLPSLKNRVPAAYG